MLDDLSFKVGQFVLLRGEHQYPIKQSDLWKIEGLQEMWYNCGENAQGQIAPLFLKNLAGETRWASPQELLQNFSSMLEWK